MEKVMSKIGKTAAKTYRYAAEGAGKIAKEIKLKSQMSDDKEQISKLYEEIGKYVYENYLLKENIDITSKLEEKCCEISNLADEVEQIRMQILNLKDLKQCPKCHYEIELEFTYCPNCGQEQQLSKKDKQNDGPATIETTDEEDYKLKKQVQNKNEQKDKENKQDKKVQQEIWQEELTEEADE